MCVCVDVVVVALTLKGECKSNAGHEREQVLVITGRPGKKARKSQREWGTTGSQPLRSSRNLDSHRGTSSLFHSSKMMAWGCPEKPTVLGSCSLRFQEELAGTWQRLQPLPVTSGLFCRLIVSRSASVYQVCNTMKSRKRE